MMLLQHISVENVLEDTVNYGNITEEQFEKVAAEYIQRYSANERAALYEQLKSQMQDQEVVYHGWRNIAPESDWNIFKLLFLFAYTVLLEEHNEIMCYYKEVLRWREVTRQIGEDLFVSAFCAVKDVACGRERHCFDWKLHIGNNNVYLSKLLKQGLAENHFHLWASAPVFEVSWIRIMNELEDVSFKAAFHSMDVNRRKKTVHYDASYREKSFSFQHLRAALIRLFLYSWLTEKQIMLDNYTISALEFRRFIRPELRDILKWEDWKLGIEDLDNYERISDVFLQTVEMHEISKENKELILDFLSRVRGSELIGDISFIKEKVTFGTILERYLEKEGELLLEWVIPLLYPKDLNNLWLSKTEDFVNKLLMNESLMYNKVRDIQNAIEGIRNDVWDYLLEKRLVFGSDIEAIGCIYGERWFLYQVFRRIQMRTISPRYCNWFYAYILIRESIRSEIVQVNSEIGLHNFIVYERRKVSLLQNQNWKNLAVQIAIEKSLKESPIKSLEARISTGNTAKENMEYIKGLDDVINQKTDLRDKYFYTMHFCKRPEEISTGYGLECRSMRFREAIEQQAMAIAVFREQYPDYASRLKGIDAASQEIDCRPEVFAQAFRFLREHTVEDNTHSVCLSMKTTQKQLAPNARDMELQQQVGMLGVTYHVGEDFMDLTDGLRAIHEAIRFLDMKCGDRLGHALALGVDVEKWYRSKNQVILISQQDYLDNLAWLHGRICRFPISGLEALLKYIESEFDGYLKKVYLQNMKVPGNYTIEAYYNAWKLRSDNPKYYISGVFDYPKMSESRYDSYGINGNCPRAHQLRKIPEVAYLYHTYHFNNQVKQEGKKKIKIHIPDIWIKGIKRLQKEMQFLVADCGIAIETNPSSNYIIGTFKDYAKHPIIQWYNAHLVLDPQKQQECPQITVSINTDDQGIFATSLENEYALMARALEEEVDLEGRHIYSRNLIYEWLDEVRKMGLRQSFD